MYQKQRNRKKFYKGEYLICIEENDDGTCDVYSTDNLFWYNFYRGDND